MTSLINWNNYIYSNKRLSLLDHINRFRQRQLTDFLKLTNKNGMSRINFYGGFTPWTNTPIAERNGGNI